MANQLLKRNMRLFGMPYQFLDTVDPRIEGVSNTVGYKFAEKIIRDAPIISIIPGRPKYMPSLKDNETRNASTESPEATKNILTQIATNEDNKYFKFYDFERSYTEYMQYVNILCRTCATFLEINETIDGVPCNEYDYKKYRWETGAKTGNTWSQRSLNNLGKKIDDWKDKFSNFLGLTDYPLDKIKYETDDDDTITSVDEALQSYNYLQFYIDSDVSFNESMSNQTTQSQLLGQVTNAGSDFFKEIAFLTNTAGVNKDVTDFLTDSTSALADGLGNFSGAVTANNLGGANGVLSNLLSLTSNLVKGENIVFPDIYQSSSYEKSYSFTVHLKTPYGNKFGYFMDICVPLMHLISLGLPKQTTANTYGAPFLVKAYCDGIFTCNMGIVTSMSITKGVNSSYSVDGLPTEVDVQLTITDLYSDMSMSPQNDIMLFLNNSSLIEYLATTCGLSLISPNIEKKMDLIIDTTISGFKDIPNTMMSYINEEIDKVTQQFLGLKL